MDSPQFREAAHSAIDESKYIPPFLIPPYLSTPLNCSFTKPSPNPKKNPQSNLYKQLTT